MVRQPSSATHSRSHTAAELPTTATFLRDPSSGPGSLQEKMLDHLRGWIPEWRKDISCRGLEGHHPGIRLQAWPFHVSVDSPGCPELVAAG